MTQICKLQTKPYSIFDDLFTDINFFRFPSIDTSTNNIRPVYDIIENDNEFIAEISLAGIKKEDINIDVNDNILSIKAEKKTVEVKYNHKESFSGIYQKSFTLPNNINKEDIASSFIDGILTITIPKTIEVKSKIKKIEIK